MNKKDVTIALVSLSFTGCLFASEPDIVKGDEEIKGHNEEIVVRSYDRDVAFKKNLEEVTSHCYYWESTSTERIKK